MPQVIAPNIALEFGAGVIKGQYFDYHDSEIYVWLHDITYPSGKTINLSDKHILVWSPLEKIKAIRHLN